MSDPNSTAPADATTEAAAGAAGTAADPHSTNQPGVDQPGADEPSADQLAEPSTEKEPGEEPTAPDGGDTTAGTDEPSHEATGIGVLGVDDE